MHDESSSNLSLPSKPIGAWISEIRDANARGELLQAFDLAERALEDFPDDSVLQYNAVLALASVEVSQAPLRMFITGESLGCLAKSFGRLRIAKLPRPAAARRLE